LSGILGRCAGFVASSSTTDSAAMGDPVIV
jgi:hypothetical protein